MTKQPIIIFNIVRYKLHFVKIKWYIFLLIFFSFIDSQAQDLWPENTKSIRIDSIDIQKNWRTKNRIILNELGIRPGMVITKRTLEEGIIKIWNVGNFSDVKYFIETFQNNRTLLTIVAKDAITIVPIVSFSGNKEDFKLTLGVSDNNFLGKNLKLGLVGSYGSNVKDLQVRFGIPRQLLYKNMAIYGRFTYGHNEQYRYDNGEKISGVGYDKLEIGTSISNPWNEDFKYTFSPDLGITYFQHTTDSIFNLPDIPPNGYKVNYLNLSFSESIGYIAKKRHQRDGYLISGAIGAGIGLDGHSPHYISLGLSATYNKLFNRIVQLRSQFSTAYTTSEVPSLIFYKGGNDVKGLLYGEISGKAYYTAYIGGHFTYVNRNWFAMEQSLFVNWGNGKDIYMDIFTTAPLGSIGTGLSFMVPMIPWLYVNFFYTISNGHNPGFSIDF